MIMYHISKQVLFLLIPSKQCSDKVSLRPTLVISFIDKEKDAVICSLFHSDLDYTFIVSLCIPFPASPSQFQQNSCPFLSLFFLQVWNILSDICMRQQNSLVPCMRFWGLSRISVTNLPLTSELPSSTWFIMSLWKTMFTFQL